MGTKNLIFDPDGDITFMLSAETKKTSAQPASKRIGSQNQSREVPVSDTPKVSMLVSSKHLSLSSKVFKAMLGPAFQEGNALRQNGMVEISLPDDDAASFEVLMGIVHAKTRKMPKEVTLKFLSNVALLVDKYDLYESVATFGEIWISHLKRDEAIENLTEPTEIRDWLSASIVFQDDVVFTKVTQLIIQSSLNIEACDADSEQNNRLPIPQPIIDDIEVERVTAIQKSLTVFNDLIMRYQRTVMLCPHRKVECDATVLGSMIKGACASGIWPLPELPYKDETILGISQKLHQIHIMTICQAKSTQPAAHGLQNTLSASLEQISQSICGLDLEHYIQGQKNGLPGNRKRPHR